MESLLAPPRLDSANADVLDRHFDEAIRAGCYNITISLRDTIFLSSAGIRALTTGLRKLGKLGGALRLVEVSQAARNVLEMSGLSPLFTMESESVGARQDQAGIEVLEKNAIRFEIEKLPSAPIPVGRVIGAGAPLPLGAAATLQSLPLAPDLCGVGLGAFGARDNVVGAQAGEWMAACGVALSLPPDSHAADYMIATPAYQPENQMLNAICFPGRFVRAARFKPVVEGRGIGLCDLLDAAFSWSGASRLGVLLAAESAGLVGATITTSPVQNAVEDFFAHPGIRERLAFTSEPEFNGELALVAGLACQGAPPAAWRPFLRPMDAARGLQAHLHAAVFTYAAIPSGRLEPEGFVRQLVERERIRTLLHLINDHRPHQGAGDSCFHNGVVWTTPLEAAT